MFLPPPSSSHFLARMVLAIRKEYRKAPMIRRALESQRKNIAHFAGIYGADWAITQLSTEPFVTTGWPAPCKAARMRLRKAAQQ